MNYTKKTCPDPKTPSRKSMLLEEHYDSWHVANLVRDETRNVFPLMKPGRKMGFVDNPGRDIFVSVDSEFEH
jgi:hypothetical protein